MTPRRIVLLEPPARTSHECEVWRAVPDWSLTVIGDRGGWGSDETIVLESRGLPMLRARDGWAATPRWLRGIERLHLPGTTCVASVELFSIGTLQGHRLAKRLGVPHIVHVAETMADNPLYRVPPYGTITRRVGIGADAVVCTTERARSHAIALGCPPDRVHVVHLGVDTEEFRPARQGRHPAPHVLFVGALREDRGADKGVFDVLEACIDTRRALPDLRATFVGDGPLARRLRDRTESSDWVTVAGQMDRAELPDLFRSSRVLALGSKRTWKWEEQFGYVLVEAMASGLPVVTTTSGAIPEVVPAWNPLVEEGDIAAMSRGLVAAMGPAGDAIGTLNREHCVEHFDLRGCAAALGDLLDKATAGSSATHTQPTRTGARCLIGPVCRTRPRRATRPVASGAGRSMRRRAIGS